jgi:hypothetical protein
MDKSTMDKWNNPKVRRAVEEIVPAMMANVDEPEISDATMSDDERAMAYYIARSFVRIVPMVVDEIDYMRLIS